MLGIMTSEGTEHFLVRNSMLEQRSRLTGLETQALNGEHMNLRRREAYNWTE